MEILPFFNREVERNFLVESRNQFVVLEGPTGYGKTRLLSEIRQIYTSDAHFSEDWKCIFVSRETAYHGTRIPWLIEDILKKLAFPIQYDDDREITVKRLAESVKEASKSLLIMIDDVDKFSDEDFIWMRYELPFHLRAVLGTKVRLILSGRHIRQRERGLIHVSRQIPPDKRKLPFYHYPLTAFDKGVVQQAIRWFKQDRLIKFDDVFMDRCTEEIHFLSCGHPEAIIALTDDLTSGSGRDWETLIHDPYLSEASRRRLFEKSLSIIADDVLSRMMDDITGQMLNGPGSVPVTSTVIQDLETVALLRRFNRGFFAQLRDLELISTEPTMLEGMLVIKGLFVNVEGTSWQDASEILELLAFKQRYNLEQRESYLKKQRQLHNVFHQRVFGRDAKGVAFARPNLWLNETNILFSAFESIFHFLSGLDRTQNTDENLDMKHGLIDLVITYISALAPYCNNYRDALDRFQDRLEHASQTGLHFLARLSFGDDVWLEVMDQLRETKRHRDQEETMSLDPETMNQAYKLILNALGYLTEYAGRWLNRPKSELQQPAVSDEQIPISRTEETPEEVLPKTPQQFITEEDLKTVLVKWNFSEIKRVKDEIKDLMDDRLPKLDENVRFYQKKLDREHPENELLFHEKLDEYTRRRDEAEARLAELIRYLSNGHINLVRR